MITKKRSENGKRKGNKGRGDKKKRGKGMTF